MGTRAPVAPAAGPTPRRGAAAHLSQAEGDFRFFDLYVKSGNVTRFVVCIFNQTAKHRGFARVPPVLAANLRIDPMDI